MKIQCSCGAKFAFEVTPELAREPVRFVCPACGLDSSEFVASLVRQELGIAPPPPDLARPPVPVARAVAVAPMPVAVAQAPVATAVAPPPRSVSPPRPVAQATYTPPSTPSGLKVHRDAPVATVESAAEAPSSENSAKRCLKHPGQFAIEQCRVCSKPLCPQCMMMFGYVCSPLCRGKAEAQGIDLPVYAAQKNVVEARLWRKMVLITGSVGGGIALILGVWFWYAWFGSVPSTIFSVRFPEKAYAGSSAFAGKDQIVFLHGGTLARYDMKSKKEIWSRYLIDKAKLQQDLDRIMKTSKEEIDKANSDYPEFAGKMPDPVKLAKELERSAAAALELRVAGENIWVQSRDQLTRYDWASGTQAKELPIKSRFGNVIRHGDELLLVDDERGKRTITHIDLKTSDIQTEQIGGSLQPEVAAVEAAPAKAGKLTGGKSQATAGLPVGTPGKDSGKPLDPTKVAQQAQHLPLPAKIALPAVLASNRSQERTLKELEETSGMPKPGGEPTGHEKGSEMIPTKKGFIQVSSKLLERKTVTRAAMKAANAKKVIGSDLKASQSLEAANEMLNDMQRERGGDSVVEDESRYQIKLRHPDTDSDWVGEIIGGAEVFPLPTVTVIAGNKMIIVLDKTNKKLWQATLTYNVSGSYRDPEQEDPRYGEGPCVEKDKTLYVCDQGVLTAFDLTTGNVKWRLPSVGISGMYFDDKGMIYLNTTDAGPDTIKYSRQIDVTQRIGDVVMKVDPATGKTLWTAHPGSGINYISGKFIYSVESYAAMDEEDESPYSAPTGFETLPHVRIKRIDPKTGKVLWEHYQARAPLDVEFDKNLIRLVFKKEVQVLRYLTF